MSQRDRLQRIYHNMITRCENPNYDKWQYYGGKGIKVCPEWRRSFAAFWGWAYTNGYNDSLTLDRIDVNGDYCPENCRWVTMKQQANNRTTNHFLEYNGIRKTIAEWSEISGINEETFRNRIKAGWPIARALTEPTNNTRVDRFIEYNGETKKMYEWANEVGVPSNTIRNRLNAGWSPERALTEPVARRA